MLVGVIDIGSNTIKAFVYQVNKHEITVVKEQYVYAYLISHVKDSMLTEEGISVLLEAGKELRGFLDKQGCDKIYAFATSAMRDAENSSDVRQMFFTHVGVEADLVSEEDEARYDALSLSYFSGSDSGIGLDLGGGSGQIFTFEFGEVIESVSLPIGVLRTKNRIVKGDFPTEAEQKQIDQEIKAFIAQSGKVKQKSYDSISIMGGTAVTLFTVLKALDLASEENQHDIQIKLLMEARDRLIAMGEELIPFLEEYAYGRVFTTLPGIAILLAIGSYFGCASYAVYGNGVREGYLIDKEQILS